MSQENGNGPAANGAVPQPHQCTHYIAGIRRRRAATYRVEQLDCRCVDPWTCRHYDGPPSDRMVDGYRDAAQHLLAQGLTPAPNVEAMRALWRRRGGDDQRLVREIAGRWGLAA